MATASMQNRNLRQQAQQPNQQQGSVAGKAKLSSSASVSSSATANNPSAHHRETPNDRQENKMTWGRKGSAPTTNATTTTTGSVNRATTPSSSQSRTNSPAPATATTNAWATTTTTTTTNKPDERPTASPNDMFTHLLFTLISQSIILHTRNGASISGILTSFDFQPDLALVLSHVLPYPLPDPVPPPKKHCVIHPKDISSITAAQVSLTPTVAPPSAFRTDTAISGAGSQPVQRNLERWQPDTVPTGASNTGLSGSLDHSLSAGAGGGGGQWDQFATNEKMFGVKTSYNEEIYTTKLDRSHPEFEKKYKQAESIAREIEGRVSSNPHIQEERNQKVDDSGIDEEDKYAGVIRPTSVQPASNNTTTPPTMGYAAAAGAGTKYQPPAKRAEAKAAAAATAAQGDQTQISSKLLRTIESEKPTTDKPVVDEKPKPILPLHVSANGATRDVPFVKESEDQTPQIQEAGQKFVKEEKVKLKRARNLIGTKEKQRQFAEFAEFSNSLTLSMPVPQDLLPILAGKDANKQKAILERNIELRRKAEEKKEKSASNSPAVEPTPPVAVASPISSPGPTLTERLKINMNRAPGAVPSPIASPTPVEPVVVKPPATGPKKLDPSAKEFVFKASAKEFKPSFATPSTHSPSPSRSSVVSPPPARPRSGRIEEKPHLGFWDKKPRRDTPPIILNTINTISSTRSDFQATNEGERFQIAMAYSTHPAWSLSDGEDSSSKGYLDVFTEGKSLPATPTSLQDDQSQSGHNYSRSSSVHPHHPTPHPPQPIAQNPPVAPGYTTAPQQMYLPMAGGQYGFMTPQPQTLVIPPQAGVQPGFSPNLVAGQFQPHAQGSPYPRFQQGYQSVSPSPLMQHAIPVGYSPQPPYSNGQYQGYPSGPVYSPYGYGPPQQANGGYSGHPSPGRPAQPLMFSGMTPMNIVSQPQLYQDTSMMRHQSYQPQSQMSLRTPPQPSHIPPHQGGYQHSPGRNNSYASAAGHPTPTHSRRQSTQPPTEDDK